MIKTVKSSFSCETPGVIHCKYGSYPCYINYVNVESKVAYDKYPRPFKIYRNTNVSAELSNINKLFFEKHDEDEILETLVFSVRATDKNFILNDCFVYETKNNNLYILAKECIPLINET